MPSIAPQANNPSSNYQRMFKRRTTHLLVLAIVFEMSLLAVTVVIVLGAVHAHQDEGHKHDMTCVVIVGMFGCVGMIGSTAVIWLIWRQRTRPTEQGTADEELKERSGVQDTALEDPEAKSRSPRRGRTKQRQPRREKEPAPSVSSGTAETRKSKISSWTHHLDLEDSSSEEIVEASGHKEDGVHEEVMSPTRRVDNQLSQEIIERVSRPTSPTEEATQSSLAHVSQPISPKSKRSQESFAHFSPPISPRQQEPTRNEIVASSPTTKASSSTLSTFRNFAPIDGPASLHTGIHRPQTPPNTVSSQQTTWHTPASDVAGSPPLALPAPPSSSASASISNVHPYYRTKALPQPSVTAAVNNHRSFISQSGTTLFGSPPTGIFDPHKQQSPATSTSPTFPNRQPRSPPPTSPSIPSPALNRLRSATDPSPNPASTDCTDQVLDRNPTNLPTRPGNRSQNHGDQNIRPAQSLKTLINRPTASHARSDLKEIRRVRAAQSADDVLPLSRFAHFRNNSFANTEKDLPPLPPPQNADSFQWNHHNTQTHVGIRPAVAPAQASALIENTSTITATNPSLSTPIGDSTPTNTADLQGEAHTDPAIPDIPQTALTETERKKLGAKVRGLAKRRASRSTGLSTGMGGGWW